jgi:TonB-linked SusC/RagA family outer membrane protein
MNYKDTRFAGIMVRSINATILTLIFCFVATGSVLAQKTVSGKVSFADTKKPIAGAKVTTRGASRIVGTFSKPDGTFSLSVPDGSTKLVFEYVGMKKQEIAISGDVVNVELKEDVLQLQELIVTGVGITQEKKQLTYATQEVKAAELTSSRQDNVVNALASQVAGLTINATSGSPGASSNIRIRGFSSITGRNQPLFVIDGVPIDNSPAVQSGTSVGGVDISNRSLDLNPDDIESINVLKGAAATALYGIQAGPGVIIVTTKKGKNDGQVNVSYSYTRGFNQVNKLPEFQSLYGQGTGGNIRGPQNGTSTSWGPKIDTLFWDGNKSYDWDANGQIIGQTAAQGNSSAKKFVPYQNQQNFFTTGQNEIHNVSVSGGNAVSRFFFGATESNNTGVVPNASLEKTTLRLNADYKLGPDFTIAANVQYNRSNQVATERGSNVGGVILGLFRTPITFDNANSAAGVTDPVNDIRSVTFSPTSSRYVNAAGALNQRTYRGTGVYENPYWVVQRNLFHSITERTLGNVQLTYEPQTWFGKDVLGTLNVTWRLGGDFYTTNSYQNTPINSVNNPGGAVYNVDDRRQIINSDLIISLNKEFDENTHMGIVIGNNAYQNYNKTYSAFATTLAIPDFYNISNAVDPAVISQYLGVYRLGAWYGKIDFSLFKEILNINATVRSDWSTTLPAAANPFFSYSAAASFIFSDLLQLDQEVFSFGKLRASFGRIGNDAGSLLYANTTPLSRGVVGGLDGWVNNGVTFPVNGIAGFQKSFTVGAGSTLRPETKTEFEIGTELKFFQNRLNLDVTYYNNNIQDLILTIPTSSPSGFQNRTLNAASMNNNGVEIQLGATIVQTEDFTLKATINWTKINNIVTALAPGVPNYQIGGFTGSGIYLYQGQQYGQIYGQGWQRNKQGQIMVGDDGFPLLTDTNRTFGANIPDWTAGIRLSANYKGFNLSALLDIKQGGVMFNGTRAALNNFGMSKESEDRGKSTFTTAGGQIQVVNNVFQGVLASTVDANNNGGTPNNIKIANIGQNWWGNQGIYNTFNSSATEPFVENAGWVRLREVSLSYDFPREMLSGTGFITGLQLFATGRNLWLSTQYTGVDPETNLQNASAAQGFDYFNNPGTRSYNFGVKISF